MLRVARLVVPEDPYEELAEHLGVPASWPIGQHQEGSASVRDGSWNDGGQNAIAWLVTGRWAAAEPFFRRDSTSAATMAACPPGLARQCWRSAVVAPDRQLAPVRSWLRRNRADRWSRRRRPEPRRPARPGPWLAHRSWPGRAGVRGCGLWRACNSSIAAARRGGPLRRRTSHARSGVPESALQRIDGWRRRTRLLRPLLGDVSLLGTARTVIATNLTRPRSQGGPTDKVIEKHCVR